MKASCSLVTFRIDIDFPDADVDVAIGENWKNSQFTPFAGDFKHKITTGSVTPTSESVNFCLEYLYGCAVKISPRKWEITNHIVPLKEFKDLKVNVVNKYGLMQGTCHLIFEVDYELFSPELVQKVTKLVQDTFKKYVKYYKTK